MTTPPPTATTSPHDGNDGANTALSSQLQAVDGQKQTPAKLRSSCDECAAAKVRCDKARPECARRLGKARKRLPPLEEDHRRSIVGQHLQFNWDNMLQDTGNKNFQISSWPEKGPVASRWNPHNQTSGAGSVRVQDRDAATIKGGTLGLHWPKETAIPTLHPTSLTDDAILQGTQPASPFDFDEYVQSFPSSIDFQDSPYFMHTDSAISVDTAPTSATTNALDLFESTANKFASSTLSTSDTPKNSTHNCYELAYSSLERLDCRPENPVSNQLSSTPITQTLDHILSQNKAAMNDVLKLLNCCCLRDPHLVMLSASIVAKILTGYQVAAGCKGPTSLPTPSRPSPNIPSSNSSSTVSTTESGHSLQTTSCKPTSSTIVPTQIKIGSFDLDEKDQESFMKHLLLNELKKLGNLVDVFSGLGAGKEHNFGLDDLYSNLGGWLKTELARTVRALKNGIETADELKEF
ncbi:hypothetical protein B0O99DRAFT_679223 [Bisporella sp. PMI_857]|nr:hypothetical protein B0O99DRAFT_679223 [Bisporella sp. PMI_857]